MTPRLSKSRIQSGRQCHKRLWLELYDRDAATWDDTARARLDEGTRFGELARALLGGGVLIEADHLHTREALAATQAALAQPASRVPMLFEAAFTHEDVSVRVDAYQRASRGDTVVEVKSSTSVKEEHLWDCAIQVWVARGAGRTVRKVELGHVDNTFVYTVPGDYTGLLKRVDITAEVEALQEEIPRVVAALKRVAAGALPDIRTGKHCATPYECPFIAHCRKDEPPIPDFPVELLPRAGALVDRLRSEGHRDLREVPLASLSNPMHLRIAHATRTNRPYVSTELANLLAAVPYPRHYLDFETASFAVPRWLGTRPYQPLPFQFSCHHESASGELAHTEFLDASGDSPLASFVDRLLEAVGTSGPIVVWNQGFEASRLKDLATMFPSQGPALLHVIERMVDLLPIHREHYYHRDMKGSWSIKAVLPTVAPDLDYANLDLGGGTDAQAAYMESIHPDTTDARRAELRGQMLAYCRRDTYAMVRLMHRDSAG